MSILADTVHIVIATNNQGKIKEFESLLKDTQCKLSPQSDFGVGGVAETGLSFVENALIKARHCCKHTDLPCIADDSGIVVDALRGAPGIYSARFARTDFPTREQNDRANNRLLLEKLKAIPETQRSARFHCALVFMRFAEDPCPLVCQASWEGQILFEPRGENGFGYDPLFYLPLSGCSSAELSSEQKNRISHRGQAMRKLLTELTR